MEAAFSSLGPMEPRSCCQSGPGPGAQRSGHSRPGRRATVAVASLVALPFVLASFWNRASWRCLAFSNRENDYGLSSMHPELNDQKVLEARKAIMAAETDRDKRVLQAVQAVREERRRKIALKGDARASIERAMRKVEKAKEDRDESCRAAKQKLEPLKERLERDEKSGEVSYRDLERAREKILALKTDVKDIWEKGQIRIVEAEAELAEMKLHSFKIKADARASLRREKVALQDVRKEEERRFQDETRAPRKVLRRAMAIKIGSPIFALGRRLKKMEEDFPSR